MKIYTYSEIKKFARQIANKKLKETRETLIRQDDTGYSVAHELAYNSDIIEWETSEKDILMMQDKDGYSVAHWLSFAHPTWTTDDPEILSLYTPEWEETVEDFLVQREKI